MERLLEIFDDFLAKNLVELEPRDVGIGDVAANNVLDLVDVRACSALVTRHGPVHVDTIFDVFPGDRTRAIRT